MFEVKVYEFLLEAVTPIAHHEATFGNHAVVFRRKARQPDGSWAMVPYVTGDTMRHKLREAAAFAFLDAAGLLDEAALTDAALRLLFNGGMVSGKGDGGNIKLDAYREMVDLVPSLALLGGCASNRVIPGRITVDDAVLICSESIGLVPEWMRSECPALDSARSHIEQTLRVRMDATLDPSKARLLGEGAKAKLAGKLRASEEAAATDDIVAAQDAKSTMMPRTFEAIAAGSHFTWRVEARCTSELDVDTFHTMIAAFLSNATVGGKGGTGHGRIRAVTGRGLTVNRPAERLYAIDALALSPKLGDVFRKHVKERAVRAREFLQQVDA
jgi:CRISPR type IV-associated protein Csf2